jgi:hypothetical protein
MSVIDVLLRIMLSSVDAGDDHKVDNKACACGKIQTGPLDRQWQWG